MKRKWYSKEELNFKKYMNNTPKLQYWLTPMIIPEGGFGHTSRSPWTTVGKL